MTAFSTITQAFVAILSADPAVSPNVFRARDRQIGEEIQTAVNVQFEGSDSRQGSIFGAPVDWFSKITVDCYARSSTITGDVAVDPVMSAVYTKLAADTTLGGLVADIGTPTIESYVDAQGQRAGWVRLTYTVSHRTSNLTLD